ncbi:MAG: ribbon-helix-helix protein, CopG family [bacterium]|nr:ribbon-helix-helix protein, CopG family [bacterium]
MQRYQIYLEPESVGVLDELAKLTSFSRSRIIRDVISRMAREYKKLLEKRTQSQMKNNPLLKMAGFAKGPGRDISHHVNDIYLKD